MTTQHDITPETIEQIKHGAHHLGEALSCLAGIIDLIMRKVPNHEDRSALHRLRQVAQDAAHSLRQQ